MGFEGLFNEEQPADNNNNNIVHGASSSRAPVARTKSQDIFKRIALRLRQREINAALAKKASEDSLITEGNNSLRTALVGSSLKIDTVFGYDFEYHENGGVESAQILHPYLTSDSTAFGGSLASLLHGRISLPRMEGKAGDENAKWLIFARGRGLYCISLNELVSGSNFLGLAENSNIGAVNAKLNELGISRYGWASDDKKERLIPHAYVTYVDALLASLFSLPFYLLPAPYNLFGFMFTMGIFFCRLHPQLEAIHYQKHKNGRRPSIEDSAIIWRDAVTLGLQAGLAATVTTFMMNIELHQAIGFNMSDAFSCVMPNILPACAVLTLSLVTGLALGAALLAIAKARHNETNPYTNAQLARVFAAGFIAGALIYPFLMASSNTSQPLMCTLFLEYVISLSLGSALHLNVKDRLDVAPKKPVILSKFQEIKKQKPTSAEIHAVILNPHAIASGFF